MVFLTSNGLTSQQLKEKFKSCLKSENAKCAIVPTAMEKDKQKDIWLEETANELQSLGLDCTFFYIGHEHCRQLANYDVIYLCGGNVFYLMQMINEHNCRETFARLAKEKIIVGVSAGSLIMQKDLTLIRDLIPKMNKRVKLKDLSGLNLTGEIEHLPHKTRYTETIDAFEKRVKTYQRKTGREVICLEDGQGIFIDGDTYQIIL